MIDACELRIGNQLDKGKVKSIYYDRYDRTIGLDDGLHYSEFELSPMRLTSEILEKCGFYKGDHPMAGEIYIIDIQKSTKRTLFISHGPSRLAVLCEEKNGEIATEFVSYLHEVQNLYFALTRKELNVQL